MPRVVLMCGPAGSGKSTYARGLEAQGWARLSLDTLAWERGWTTMPLPAEVHAELERDLNQQLLTLVGEGRDVVLDRSFHSRAMREQARRLLRSVGVEPETVYLATDRETVLHRLAARAGGHADDYVLPPELAERYFDGFEVPSPEEGPLLVVPPTASE